MLRSSWKDAGISIFPISTTALLGSTTQNSAALKTLALLKKKKKKKKKTILSKTEKLLPHSASVRQNIYILLRIATRRRERKVMSSKMDTHLSHR